MTFGHLHLPHAPSSSRYPTGSLFDVNKIAALPSGERNAFLSALLRALPSESLLLLSTQLAPLLKRDFLTSLPPEISLQILEVVGVGDVKSLVRCRRVCRAWKRLIGDEGLWRGVGRGWGFGDPPAMVGRIAGTWYDDEEGEESLSGDESQSDVKGKRKVNAQSPIGGSSSTSVPKLSPSQRHFRASYISLRNWHLGRGQLLRSHRLPPSLPPNALHPLLQPQPNANHNNIDAGVVTSCAIDAEWIVVGLASSRIHVFSRKTGVLSRTLVGHGGGVWAVWIVSIPQTPSSSSPGLPEEYELEPDPHPSDPSNSSIGFEGQGETLVLSGGTDKRLHIFSLPSGRLVAKLRGVHTSTIRCVKAFGAVEGVGAGLRSGTKWGADRAVTGGRDGRVVIWNLRAALRKAERDEDRDAEEDEDDGEDIVERVLEGHAGSVRCLDVWGDKVVSGSYDHTLRVSSLTLF